MSDGRAPVEHGAGAAAVRGGAEGLSPGGFPAAFVLLWFVVLVAFAGTQLLTASLPFYAIELGADELAVGMMTGVIATVALVTRPFVGSWIDMGHGLAALIVGALVFATCSAGFWMSSSVAHLLALRALSGVAIAMFVTSSQTLAANLAPIRRRGEGMSMMGAASTLSQGFAPPAGVALVQASGYQGLFAASTAAGLLSAVLASLLRRVRTTAGCSEQEGPVAATTGAPPSPSKPHRRRLLHPGVTLPGLLVVSVAVTFGANFALLAVHAGRRGLPNPGTVFIAHAAGLFLAQLIGGRLSDRYGRTAAILPGLGMCAAGMWAIAALPGAWLYPSVALVGMGLGAASPSLYALAADLVPPPERGSAMATLGVFHEIGIGSGAVGGGLIARAFGLDVMYGLGGVAPAIGFLAALATLLPRAPRGK